MKNPHSLSNTCKRSINEPIQISTPGANKKFKRKSREPKRLDSYPVDTSDVDSMEDVQTDVSMLAPLQRQLMMSQDATVPAASLAPTQSGAIDMRIGINVPAGPSHRPQLPAAAFASPEIAHWPPAIYQPLSSRLKLGFCSTPPLPQQAFSPQTPQYHSQEPGLDSPQDSPRRQVGVSDDGHGRLPEVKAIQQTRRLLANARERTRVHTISAAFEALRKQVPCYSYGQKLSKLAILRIACNYILSLAQLAELDYSPASSSLSFSQCVEQCSRTLQAEGRSKKRKE
ncbi:transcription factor atoh8 [Brachionichthys hirsutus]|uniref:transcription factor atoh8 n=1 Tax=Brachionichthys hirsutus TaxID=412623 RepID=UPI003605161D